ncbi:ATP-binding protein [Pseudooceanicola nanhaiensis]|uniref:hybrid sensor histidine kinase/response regulator n=1 Tax=Pseudooceanicola nanhaiensis TaxID=375761 RepID=UPI001CD75206|nr:ATP-binding protein [Pseudooceanicola nanhaiensis]MCA0921673.1 response regulator [Pseudooceanicola nanhaiensis]
MATPRVQYPEPPSFPAAIPADFALASALKDLRRRYDILYSRVDTLMRSPLYISALNAPRMEGTFVAAAQEIFDWAHIIDLPDPALIASAEALQPRVAETRPQVRRIMTVGNQALVTQSDLARREVADVLYRLALVSLVLLIALSSLVAISLRLAVLSGRRASQVSATTARLATIVDTSQDAIVVLTPRGVLETLNEAGQEMFGLNEEEATGARIGTLLRRETAEGTRAVSGRELTEACAEGRKRGYRLIGRNADGRTFPVELSMDTAQRDDRAVLVCMIRDISHQAETEAELVESRDRALAGERAKARFLGVISHEMRTPLNGILGTIELMDDSDEASRSALVPVLRNSAQVLLGLVNDVLDLTQIEGAGARLTSAPFDLDTLLEELIDSEVPRAQARGNQLMRTPGAPPLGWVSGDRGRLRQILLNLVSNAVKFTRGGQITLDAARVGERQVEFQVCDTGIGMSAEDAEKIFEDFVRLDSALREQVQGTGLGLGIARQLARAMGGEIGVESEEGQGSLFWVRLPLPAAEPQVQPDTGQDDGPQAGPPLEVLLVEDNATNRLVARKMLERDGHSVTEAHDGAEGLQAARSRAFDLILMDVSMPVMDGATATRHIRAGNGPCRDARIVALTAHIGEDVAQDLRNQGVDEVVAKPLRWRDLRRVLRGGGTSGMIHPRVLEELWEATGPAQAQVLIRCYITEGGRLQEDWHALAARIDAPGEAPAPADADRLAEVLHRFAGSSATFGAVQLTAALRDAELAARSGDRPACIAALAHVDRLWPRTHEALDRWLAERGEEPTRPGPLRRALP